MPHSRTSFSFSAFLYLYVMSTGEPDLNTKKGYLLYKAQYKNTADRRTKAFFPGVIYEEPNGTVSFFLQKALNPIQPHPPHTHARTTPLSHPWNFLTPPPTDHYTVQHYRGQCSLQYDGCVVNAGVFAYHSCCDSFFSLQLYTLINLQAR